MHRRSFKTELTSFLLVEAHNHANTAARVSEQSLLLQPQGRGCLLVVGLSLILQITTRRPEAAQKQSSSCKGSATILTACRYPTPLLRPVCQKFSEAGGRGKLQYLCYLMATGWAGVGRLPPQGQPEWLWLWRCQCCSSWWGTIRQSWPVAMCCSRAGFIHSCFN